MTWLLSDGGLEVGDGEPGVTCGAVRNGTLVKLVRGEVGVAAKLINGVRRAVVSVGHGGDESESQEDGDF